MSFIQTKFFVLGQTLQTNSRYTPALIITTIINKLFNKHRKHNTHHNIVTTPTQSYDTDQTHKHIPALNKKNKYEK